MTIVGGTVTCPANIYPGNRITGKVGTLILDGTTMTVNNSSYTYPGYYSTANNYGTADIIITNGAQLSTGYLYGRHGTIRQYSGTVKVTNQATGLPQ